MATGFVSEIEIWEVVVNGMPTARFVDEESADEYIYQVKVEAITNCFLSPYVETIRKYPCSVVKFIGRKESD